MANVKTISIDNMTLEDFCQLVFNDVVEGITRSALLSMLNTIANHRQNTEPTEALLFKVCNSYIDTYALLLMLVSILHKNNIIPIESYLNYVNLNIESRDEESIKKMAANMAAFSKVITETSDLINSDFNIVQNVKAE